MADPCKCGNKPSAYMKGEKCIHKLSGYQLLTKDVTPCSRIMGMVENKDITVLPVQETRCHNTILFSYMFWSLPAILVWGIQTLLFRLSIANVSLCMLSLHMQYAVVTENLKPNTLYDPTPPCVSMS
jgi:hypothetical protein